MGVFELVESVLQSLSFLVLVKLLNATIWASRDEIFWMDLSCHYWLLHTTCSMFTCHDLCPSSVLQVTWISLKVNLRFKWLYVFILFPVATKTGHKLTETIYQNWHGLYRWRYCAYCVFLVSIIIKRFIFKMNNIEKCLSSVLHVYYLK